MGSTMSSVIAETAKNTDQENQEMPANTALDRAYQQIGIQAVAAAVRYQGVAKNPAYAPVQIGGWPDFEEAAA